MILNCFFNKLGTKRPKYIKNLYLVIFLAIPSINIMLSNANEESISEYEELVEILESANSDEVICV